MRARLNKWFVAVGALAALAVGGSAVATAAQKGAPPVNPPAATSPAPADGDNVQQGDQAAPDTGSAAEQANESAVESPASESASESGPSDGPGGYADTSANADTLQTGEHKPGGPARPQEPGGPARIRTGVNRVSPEGRLRPEEWTGFRIERRSKAH
jgi:hypothetical protein